MLAFKRSFIMARSNQVVGFKQNEDGTQTYTVGGQTKTFNPDSCDPTLRTRAELHGWRQRIQDKAALSRDPKTGKSATAEQKRAAVWAIIDHYESGTDKWEMERTGGAGGRSDASYIMQAAAIVQDVDLKTMAERVGANAEKRGMTVDAYLRKLAQQSEAVRNEVARIKFGESEGADDMLDELGDAEEEDADDDGESDDTPTPDAE
jgi:hypothetical protein